jgi:preprotein translocase subunit SecD
VELVVVPVDEDGAPKPETIRVTDQPLLRFKTLSQFDFKFEEGECTEIGFANTPELKAYTRDHVGAQLAVVIDNRVISHHKIREPIESDTVRITCCTVGGGDHLHKHLKELKLATESNSRADNQQQREEDER